MTGLTGIPLPTPPRSQSRLDAYSSSPLARKQSAHISPRTTPERGSLQTTPKRLSLAANATGYHGSATAGPYGQSTVNGRHSLHRVSSSRSSVESMDNDKKNESEGSVRVLVRIRPILEQDIAKVPSSFQRLAVHADTSQSLTVDLPPSLTFGMKTRQQNLKGKAEKQAAEMIAKAYSFDRVYGPQISQQSLFDSGLTSLIDSCIEGFNTTIMAYGQTSSGKSFTMGTEQLGEGAADSSPQEGVISRAVRHLFRGLEKKKLESSLSHYTYSLTCTFIEIYNEDIVDLLYTPTNSNGALHNGSRARPSLTIRETSKKVIYCENAKEISVSSADEVLALVRLGLGARTTFATEMNAQSSRSHAILGMTLTQTASRRENGYSGPSGVESPQSGPGSGSSRFITKSKLNFADLAGSERLKRTEASGERIKEGININSGLHALSNVISALAASQKSLETTHVPYRASKLTRLLQDSLGGNALSVIIACVAPTQFNIAETVNTLNYMQRAKVIKNKATINTAETGWDDIAYLRKLVIGLRAQLSQIAPALSNGHADGQKGMDSDIDEEFSHGQNGQSRIAEYDSDEEDDLAELFPSHTQSGRSASRAHKTNGLSNGDGYNDIDQGGRLSRLDFSRGSERPASVLAAKPLNADGELEDSARHKRSGSLPWAKTRSSDDIQGTSPNAVNASRSTESALETMQARLEQTAKELALAQSSIKHMQIQRVEYRQKIAAAHKSELSLLKRVALLEREFANALREKVDSQIDSERLLQEVKQHREWQQSLLDQGTLGINFPASSLSRGEDGSSHQEQSFPTPGLTQEPVYEAQSRTAALHGNGTQDQQGESDGEALTIAQLEEFPLPRQDDSYEVQSAAPSSPRSQRSEDLSDGDSVVTISGRSITAKGGLGPGWSEAADGTVPKRETPRTRTFSHSSSSLLSAVMSQRADLGMGQIMT